MADEVVDMSVPCPDRVPKVFISYSWSGQAAAKRLADYLIRECRVEVVIDIYHLKAGQNKYEFMQRIVNDKTIDNVLILCDRAYRDKANNFEGGVGDEATIISPKIYEDARQRKFIPIVMEVDEVGKPYIPTFVDGRIYFDLSDPKTYVSERKRLVRELYNMPVDPEPKLADKRPTWLDFPEVDTSEIEGRVSVMAALAGKNADAGSLVVAATQDFLKSLNSLGSLANSSLDLPGVIAQTEPIRNCFVDFVAAYVQQKGADGDLIASMFEAFNNGISPKGNRDTVFGTELEEVYRFFFWEAFVCATAIMIHFGRFDCLRQMLNRTYFVRKMIGTSNSYEPIGYSYFRAYCDRLEGDYRNRMQPRPYTLAGKILVEREYAPYISKAALVNADMILSHLSVVFDKEDDAWYPMLAPYTHHAGRDLIWSKAVSRSYCEKLFVLFDVKSMDSFKKVLTQADDLWLKTNICQSGMAYGGIPSIRHAVNLEKIGGLP